MVFENYFKHSRSPINSFIIILPLFLIYEFGIWAISSQDLPTIRNGADVLLRKVLVSIGINSIYGMAVMLFIGVIIACIFHRKKLNSLKLNSKYYVFMLIESVFWSIILYLVLAQGQLLLAIGSSKLLFQQIVLSIGSGIFEEFVFRALLIGGIALIIEIFLKNRYWTKMIIAIFISAIIFSAFHFIGEFADVPQLRLFLLRLAAGIILGFVYILRGFGIAAYSHSFYNLLVFTQFQTDLI